MKTPGIFLESSFFSSDLNRALQWGPTDFFAKIPEIDL